MERNYSVSKVELWITDLFSLELRGQTSCADEILGQNFRQSYRALNDDEGRERLRG